jgi:hypothetical protein
MCFRTVSWEHLNPREIKNEDGGEIYVTRCFIYLSMAVQPFIGPWPLFFFSLGPLGRGISPSQGRYLHTGQHKRRINAHRHACLKRDPNPRPQCLSGRRPRGHCDRQGVSYFTLFTKYCSSFLQKRRNVYLDGFWGCLTLLVAEFMDFVNYLLFWKNTTFRKLNCFRPQVKLCGVTFPAVFVRKS